MVDELTNNLQQVKLDGWVEVNYAYHVTNVPADKSQPMWEKLQWRLADDPDCDGALVGFPCVAFTVWSNRPASQLSDISKDPQNSTQTECYWRVAIPLDHFNEYKILYCCETNSPIAYRPRIKQVKLILAKPSLATELQERLKWNEEDAKSYLKMEQHGENTRWYSTECDPNDNNDKTFVSFVVFDDVEIPEGSEWSSVRREKKEESQYRERRRNLLISAMIDQRHEERQAQIAGPEIPE